MELLLCLKYYAIVHPLSAMKFNSKSRTKKILAATWAIPVVLASPYTFSKSYPFVITSHMGSISRQICNDRFDEIDALMYGQGVTDRFRRGFFVFLFLVIYLLPMLVILATCVRIAICLLQPIAVRRWPPATRKDTGRRHEENKRKVARMVIVVAVAFIVSWSPFYLSTLVSQIQTISGDSFLRERNFLFTMLMIHLCGFLNSCINPLIYTGMSKKFRRSFKKILGGCICCRLTHRFLRYRDSLTRGMSAAFTSSLRHSMTEVRDANDLAPSEGGSSSPHADGFHYSARSTTNRGSHHSPSAANNSSVLRHNQQQQQQHRRQNHHRPYNLSQDQAQAQCPVPASTPPEMTKSKPRGFKLWRTREQGEVLIQLTPLKKKKQQKNGPTRGEKGEGAPAPGTGNSLNNDLLEDDERQKFIGEEDGEVEAEENEDVEAGSKLLSKPAGSSQARDGTSDTPAVLHKHCSVGRNPGSATTGGADVLPNGVASPAVKGEDCPCERGGNVSSALKTGEYQSVMGGDGEWGMPAMNGGPRHILKDSSKAWSGGKTVDFLLKDKYNSSDLVQSQNAKNNNHGLTNQQGAVVHVGFGQTGHCVQL